MGSPTTPRQKLRHNYNKERRFQRALTQFPGEDPLFPVVLHSLERYLDGTTDLSAVDAIVQEAFRTRPSINRQILSEWVKNWKTTPARVKAQFVPPELRSLTVAQKLDMDLFQAVLSRQAAEHPSMPKSQPQQQRAAYIARRLPSGISLPSEAAEVKSISPAGPDGEYYAYLGQAFTIHGKKFSTLNDENSVLLYQVIDDVAQPGLALTPAISSAETLTVVAPNSLDLAPGLYTLQVAVKGKRTSESLAMYFYKPPQPASSISQVVPAEQRPGLPVTVNGAGFGENPRVWWQACDPENQGGEPYGTEATRVSDTQIQFRVPDRLVYYPGTYSIAVSGDNQPPSNWATLTVLPFQYRVEFQKMICVDESDPEWWGDDEIVTKWVIACDDKAWTKGTGEYTGFSDNTQKDYKDSDKVVFPIDGPGAVRKDLTIGTALFEWDEGDAKAWSEALGAVADIAKAIPYGNWISAALKVFGKLVSWFGGDPDPLGQNTRHWTAADLRDGCNATGSFGGALEFVNGDDVGSYRLLYTIYRVNS